MLPVARATESTPSPICRRSVRRVGPPADARPCVAAAEPCHHKERADSNPQDPRVSLLRRCNTAGAKTHCHAAWASHRHQKESLRKELGALEPDFLLECRLGARRSGNGYVAGRPTKDDGQCAASLASFRLGIGVPVSQPRSGKEQAREPRRRDQQTRRGPFALLDDTAGTRPSMGAA
jgi:hypothetical protein